MKELNLSDYINQHPEQQQLITVFDEASKTIREQHTSVTKDNSIVSLEIINGRNTNKGFEVFLSAEVKDPVVVLGVDFHRPVLGVNNGLHHCLTVYLDDLTNVKVDDKTITEQDYYWHSSIINFTYHNIDYMAVLTVRTDNRKTA